MLAVKKGDFHSREQVKIVPSQEVLISILFFKIVKLAATWDNLHLSELNIMISTFTWTQVSPSVGEEVVRTEPNKERFTNLGVLKLRKNWGKLSL